MPVAQIDPVGQVDWFARAAALKPPEGLFIGGEYRAAENGATNPPSVTAGNQDPT